MKKLLLALGGLAWLGCGGSPSSVDVEAPKDELGAEEQRFSSQLATLLSFDFSGELVVTDGTAARAAIDEQMLYTIGHLNGERSVGRLDKLVLSNVRSTAVGDGTTRVTFQAKLPVAWGSKTNLPASYELTLPKRIGFQALEDFTTKYSHTCVDYGAHDVTSGSMWYYFRPKRSGCALDEGDVVKVTATATVSTENTTGKYPEYHQLWKDSVLKVVAIFGKNEDGATSSSDVGIAAYDRFVGAVKAHLSAYPLVTVPASLPSAPGVSAPDVTLEATLPGNKKVQVVVLLVDNVRTAGPVFDARYEALSGDADLIMYNGHAGLGSNVRALARKGRFVAGKYQLFFMNGCDTFAYVDGYLAQTRAALNADDPTGTKYMEIVTNGMPAFFSELPDTTMAMVKGLMKHEAPVTFEQIFADIDPSQVVVVTGEEDNVYYPGYDPNGGRVLQESGAVARNAELRYQTAELTAGTYRVKLAHDPASPGGDADLYVKLNAQPTTSSYDCRPYKSGSAEECTLTLAAAGRIHVSVIGYANQSSAFVLTIERQGGTPPPGPWAGLDESGTVAKSEEKRFETPLVDAGRYVFTLSGTGDADLYVKAGAAPTTSSWDCRPYRNGSAEECTMNLATPQKLHVMVRGYAASSTFRLVGKKQ